MQILICILFMAFYYGVCGFALCCDNGLQGIQQVYKGLSFFQKLFIRSLILVSLILTIYWIRKNNFVYYWDYSGYWIWSIERTEYIFSHNVIDFFKSLWESINFSEYNCFLPTIIAAPLKLIGYEFLDYVVINHLLFLIPSIIVFALASVKLCVNSCINKSKILLISMTLSIFFPANYYAMHKGYIDVAILLPISILIYLLVDYDFSKSGISRDIAIAIMFIFAWISRRYVIYFILGYLSGLLIKAIIQFSNNKSTDMLKSIIKHFAVMGCVSIGIFLICFKEFFLNALLTNYKELYSAYNIPLADKLAGLLSSFGALSMIIVLIIGIVCFLQKKNRSQYISLLLIIIVETGLFFQTQSMGFHHQMIINMPLLMIFILLCDFYSAVDTSEKNITSFTLNVTGIICALMCMINFCKAYLPNSSFKYTNCFYSCKYTPLQRNDIEQIKALAEYLNLLTSNTDKTIYVAAGGGILNSDILQKVNAPDSWNFVPNLIGTYVVDLRDGFPGEFLYATYVVATNPADTHLPSGQEVITYLSESLQDQNSCIGRHFKEINHFELDNGVIATVYEKKSDWEENDLIEMRDYYGAIYPGHEDIFENRIVYSYE